TVLDMEEAVKIGLEANNSILAARNNLQAAEMGRKAARGLFGPRLTGAYSYTKYDTDSTTGFSSGATAGGDTAISDELWQGSLTLTQPLFTGFEILSTYQQSVLNTDVARENLRQARLQLIFDIQSNFLAYLQAEENIRSAEDAVTRLESQFKVSTAFFDVGLRPKLDVLQTEADLARARQDLLAAQNNLAVQYARLNTLLSWPTEKEVEYVGRLDFTPYPLTFEQSLEKAMLLRPDLTIAEKSVALAQKDVTIAGSDFYPKVNANFQYSRLGDDPRLQGTDFQDKDDWRAGAALEWELFASGTNYYTFKRERQNVERLRAELERLREEIHFEVKSAFLNVREAASRIDVARTAVAAAKEGFRMSQARYENQVGTYTDVLDAQARLTQAEVDLTRAFTDYKTALSQLYRAMGVEQISLDHTG
ncbi:MAG: TolC family protein, partial [Desulfovibrionales bacterium]